MTCFQSQFTNYNNLLLQVPLIVNISLLALLPDVTKLLNIFGNGKTQQNYHFLILQKNSYIYLFNYVPFLGVSMI